MNKRPTMLGISRVENSERSIRVFLAADMSLVSQVAALLSATPGAEIVGTAHDGGSCLERVLKAPCDVVLVHSRLPEVSGIKVVEYLSINHPDLPAVILIDDADSATLRLAMLAGAREFLIPPLVTDQLMDTLRRVHEIEKQRKSVRQERHVGSAKRGNKNGHLLVVASGKGGVGKSFISTGLATIIAEQQDDRKIALLDADVTGGDIGVLLDLEHNKGVIDLLGVASELDAEVIRSAAKSYMKNLDCFLAPDGNIPTYLGDAETVPQLVAALTGEYDLVIANTGPLACWPSAELVALADKVLLVTTPDLASLKLCTRLRDAHEELGLSLSKIVVAVNRQLEDDALSCKRIGKLLGLQVAAGIPCRSSEVRDLVNRGSKLSAKRQSSLYEAIRYLVEKEITRGGLMPV